MCAIDCNIESHVGIIVGKDIAMADGIVVVIVVTKSAIVEKLVDMF